MELLHGALAAAVVGSAPVSAMGRPRTTLTDPSYCEPCPILESSQEAPKNSVKCWLKFLVLHVTAPMFHF